MRVRFLQPTPLRAYRSIGLVGLAILSLGGLGHAQESAPSVDNKDGWQRYDWLKSSEDEQRQAASGTSVTAKAIQDVGNPFTTVSSGALWQQKYSTVFTKRVADTLSLSVESSSTLLNEDSNPSPLPTGGSPDDLSHGQKVALQYQPADGFTLQGNLHNSGSDASTPSDSTLTSGAGFYAEGRLPTNTSLTLGANLDRTGTDLIASEATTDTTYDAQVKQPLGSAPLTLVLKAHYEQIEMNGEPAGFTPSMEQSLVWKPVQVTTVQMGLRQQTYQEYPGVDNQMNQALFADWSQNMASNVTWHSYAEVLNTKGMVDQAPASPIASGANGTAQATPPGSEASLTSSVPLSMTDQTLTFTTGPSFQIQKDISASVEYSNRWDRSPAAGSVGQEQRVSVSVKGSF